MTTDTEETPVKTAPRFKEAGDLLQSYCTRKGETCTEVGRALGISGGNMSHWRNGQFAINKKHFKPLTNYLGLSDDEAMDLGVKSYPEFRALVDKPWLDEQPKHVRAGILFRAYRIRAGKAIPELAKEIGISAQACDTWDKGKFCINSSYMPKIIEVLELSPVEGMELSARITVKPRGVHPYSMRAHSVQAGGAIVHTMEPELKPASTIQADDAMVVSMIPDTSKNQRVK